MTKTSGTKSGCDHEVVIVGGGFSGLGAGIKLREAGIHNFVILDAADGVGGVWRHNTYPGVAVDIPSATYCYSFEPNPHWSRAFAPGKELRAYAEHCADEYGLRPHLRLRTFVEKAVFDEPHDRWRVHTSEGVITRRPRSSRASRPIGVTRPAVGAAFESARATLIAARRGLSEVDDLLAALSGGDELSTRRILGHGAKVDVDLGLLDQRLRGAHTSKILAAGHSITVSLTAGRSEPRGVLIFDFADDETFRAVRFFA